MKSILCFGDSNTWGYNADTGERYPYTQRWTSILQEKLGSEFTVIPEGLNGRTSVWEDPFSPYRDGKAFLPVCLETHYPLDIFVLMLGTNDTKCFLRNSAFAISRGIRRLAEIVSESGAGPGARAPDILIVNPVPVFAGDAEKALFDIRELADIDGHDPVKVSSELGAELKRQAGELGCSFLDATEYGELSPVDGVHLTAKGHSGLAAAIYSKIRDMEQGR